MKVKTNYTKVKDDRGKMELQEWINETEYKIEVIDDYTDDKFEEHHKLIRNLEIGQNVVSIWCILLSVAFIIKMIVG